MMTAALPAMTGFTANDTTPGRASRPGLREAGRARGAYPGNLFLGSRIISPGRHGIVIGSVSETNRSQNAFG